MAPTLSSVSQKTPEIGTVSPVAPADMRAREGGAHSGEAVPAASDSPLPVPAGGREAPDRGHFAGSPRPQAPLVAQLIATHLGVPQTRILRRAAPSYADTAYRSTGTLLPVERSSRDRRV